MRAARKDILRLLQIGQVGADVRIFRATLLGAGAISLSLCLWQCCLLVLYEMHLELNPATDAGIARVRWEIAADSAPVILWPLAVAALLITASKSRGRRCAAPPGGSEERRGP